MNIPEVRLLQNYVLLDIVKGERKTKGGIILPENVQKNGKLNGYVVAVSEEETAGNKFIKHVKIGDEVLFNVNAGDVVEIEDIGYLLLRENDLYAILPVKSKLALVVN